MNAFPAFLSLKERKTVIVGGGAAALRKARLAIQAGAKPTLIWPVFDEQTKAELADRAHFIDRSPLAADFEDAALVFVAVDGPATARLADLAKAAGALVNVVDQPALCDFTIPSIIDRGRLTIAISTSGAGPVFGKALREKIEALAPARTDELLAFAERYRPAVAAKIAETDRRAFWEAFFSGPMAAAILAGETASADAQMIAALNSNEASSQTGVVHIVGAGPGDPELLTLKALRLIQSADVVLHDRLVSDEILNLARRDADRLFVGKAKANHAVPQKDIEARMVALAREGKIVVRLKGGDPFVFGRGGEELDALRAAGVPVFVTPGITAATGCAAATGMALTHRDHAQAVTFVTGYAKEGAEPDLDWSALAALKNTLVVYMGVGKAGAIGANLIGHGRAASTPVAIIENGTRTNQRIVKGQLGALEQLIVAGGIKGPALLVIGEVAALADGQGLLEIADHGRRAA